jgi:hypothetical protein
MNRGEGSINTDVPMVIDGRNAIQESKVLFGFLAIVIFCLVFGICVGSSVTIETHDQNVTISGPLCEFTFETHQPLTPSNRFLALGMVFYRPTQSQSQFPFSRFAWSRDGAPWRVSETQIPFRLGREVTEEYFLLCGSVVKQGSVSLSVRFESDGDSLNRMRLNIITGNPEHVIIQMYFRAVFSSMVVAVVAMLLARLWQTPSWKWQIEQQLTVVLLILNALAYLPYPPSCAVWERVCEMGFLVYFWSFATLLFEFSAWRNGHWQLFSVVAPTVLSIYMFFVGIYDYVPDKFLRTRKVLFPSGPFLTERGCLLLFQCLVIASIFRGYRRPISPVDPVRLQLYGSLLLSAIVLALEQVLCFTLAIDFVVPLSGYTSLVVSLAYLHWPSAGPRVDVVQANDAFING